MDKENIRENTDEKNIETETKKKKSGFIEKIRENPWVLSTFVLGILVLILLLSNFFGFTGSIITGSVISGSDAGEKLLAFYESNGVTGLELNSVEEEAGLYRINFNYQGQVIPVYMTKDGTLAGSLAPITEVSATSSSDSQTQEIPKTDRPIVELFIWAYCPYGVQAQGPLAEVASLLEDYADFEAVMYYDGHGAYETQQNKIGECIQKFNPEKYWEYATGFVENIYPKCSSTGDIDCDKTESINLMESLGIDSDSIFSCVESEGEDLLSDASARASEVGVTGSPSLVINGVKASPSSRTAEAFKTVICESFNNPPKECSQSLSSTSSTSSGSC